MATSTVFDNIYARGLWRNGRKAGTESSPASGSGSTPLAARTTCLVLREAVRRVAKATVRILDVPCGDWTWMPACLTAIASSLSVRLAYSGGDVVHELIRQLNAAQGSFLPNSARAAVGPGVDVRPFVVLDVANAAAMGALRGEFDIVVTRHVTIHLQSAVNLRIIDGWNALAGEYFRI